MSKVNKINDCYQCRYGEEETEVQYAFCHEASRTIEDMKKIPDWCPLPKWYPKYGWLK